MGTSMKEKMEKQAANVARCVGSSMARRNIRYPAYRSQQTRADVNRTSHAHQIPHSTRAQMEPVTRLPRRKASPTSVTATATASYLKFLVFRNITLATSATKERSIAVMAIGDRKKMI